MRNNIVAAVVLLAGFAAAAPVATVQSVTQDSATGNVTVGYTLSGEDAIITFDVLTNGAPVSSAALASAIGDVYRLVAHGEGSRSFIWNAGTSGIGAEFSAESLEVRVNAISRNDPPDWMAVELSVSNSVFYYPSKECVPEGITNDVYKTDRLLLRRMHADGKIWLMGKSGDVRNPLHRVTLTNDYYIGVYEVTYAQMSRMMDSLWCSYTYYPFKEYPDSRMFPASGENSIVSYYRLRGSKSWPDEGHEVADDSVLGRLRGRTGVQFDLPTEAEWEFACRGGSTEDHYGTFDDIAWNSSNSDGRTHAVGTKLPNGYDLYDMLGNVWEWVLDKYETALDTAAAVEPIGPSSGSGAVRQVRGGGYAHGSDRCAAHYRISSAIYGSNTNDAYGFRVTAPAGYIW